MSRALSAFAVGSDSAAESCAGLRSLSPENSTHPLAFRLVGAAPPLWLVRQLVISQDYLLFNCRKEIVPRSEFSV